MRRYEYQVMPAPSRAPKIRGMKAAPDRFARSLTELMNEAAAEGWEYVRTDVLPLEEKAGLTRKTVTSFQNLMVFRRAVQERAEAAPEPARAAPPPLEWHHAEPEALVQPEPEPEPEPQARARPPQEELRARAAGSLRPGAVLAENRRVPPVIRPLGGVSHDDR